MGTFSCWHDLSHHLIYQSMIVGKIWQNELYIVNVNLYSSYDFQFFFHRGDDFCQVTFSFNVSAYFSIATMRVIVVKLPNKEKSI